jgi:CRP-like cAMP-binding protein
MPLGELGREYKDGDVIFQEGDISSVMYVIQEGRVKFSHSTDRGEITLATFGPGDIFGEVALFEEGVQGITATVMGDARILTVEKEKFFKTMTRDPSLAFNLLKAMSDRIRTLDREIIKLKNMTLEILEWGMDLEEICHIVLEEARDAVEAENGSVMIFDKNRQVLKIVAAFGTEMPTKTGLSSGEGIAGHVLETGNTELLNNVEVESLFKPGELSISSMICVPLGTRQETFGVINLSNTSEERLFSQVDLKFLQSLSIYASVAIENTMRLTEVVSATSNLLGGSHRKGFDDEDNK